MKKYHAAPLPFQGQKRRFLKEFKAALSTFDNVRVIVDLFGGSGLLSHSAKEIFPKARVVYNDYDNYIGRLAVIPQTNALLRDFRSILSGLPKEKRISPELRDRILARIHKDKEQGIPVDYITLSSALLFTNSRALSFEELENKTFYNNIPDCDYNANGYLSGVEIAREDYMELFNRYKDVPGVVFLVDPPYLSTDTASYAEYWGLTRCLDVLLVVSYSQTSWFYFTSEKSEVVDLCAWMQRSLNITNPFAGAQERRLSVKGHSMNYTDIMLFKNSFKAS